MRFLFSVQLLGLAALELAGTNTGIAGWDPSIDGDTIAFFTYEGWVGADLDGDGRQDHAVIRYYSMTTGMVTNTGAAGGGPSLEGNIIAFWGSEWGPWSAGVDLNWDGDKDDYVIMYYDMRTHTVTNTMIIGMEPSLDGDIIAFATYEEQRGGDLNGDGDAEDSVIRYYDITTGVVTNTGMAGSQASLDGTIIVFVTLEDEAGLDLNGDGDTQDSVIRYYDITTGTVTSTGVEGTSIEGYMTSLDGNIIAFMRPIRSIDPLGEIGYYDMSTGTVTWGIRGWGPCVDGGIVASAIPEQEVGMDLNEDGDGQDMIISYFVIGVDESADRSTGGPDWNVILILAVGLIVAIVLLTLMIRR